MSMYMKERSFGVARPMLTFVFVTVINRLIY